MTFFDCSGMTTGIQATADSALFIHQMIPHHQNAVNTAKSLLKMGSLLCPDLTDTTNSECQLEGILRDIIGGQNHQIQLMRHFLNQHGLPQTDNCDVYVETVQRDSTNTDSQDSQDLPLGSGTRTLGKMGWSLLAVFCSMGLVM